MNNEISVHPDANSNSEFDSELFAEAMNVDESELYDRPSFNDEAFGETQEKGSAVSMLAKGGQKWEAW